jgi:hypothetical protein
MTRDERNKFLASGRKQQREAFYNKLMSLILNESSSLDIKDRIWALRLCEHKIAESKEKK